jgi:hypothetical protein
LEGEIIMYNECRHIKSDGKRCRAAALKGKPYCFFHIKSAHLYRRTIVEIPRIEDSASVLLGIGQVLHGLNVETMDFNRARLMLYGLQIAASVTARIEKAQTADSAADTVRSIHNAQGEPVEFTDAFFSGAPMLAPENSVCEPPQDCANCAQKDSCDKPNADGQPTNEDRWHRKTPDPERAALGVRRYLLAMLERKRAAERSSQDRDGQQQCEDIPLPAPPSSHASAAISADAVPPKPSA